MSTNDSQTLLLESNLGLVGNYDPTIPLARLAPKDSLHAGRLYLRATLDEMIRIRGLAKNSDENRDLLREAKAQYDDLSLQREELEAFERRHWLYKFFKSSSKKRAIRAFAHDAFVLWDSTAKTSDNMKRVFLSTRTTDLTTVECKSIVKDEPVSGLAVEVNGPITQEAVDTVQEAASILALMNSSPVLPPPNSQASIASTGTTLVADESSSARSSISAVPGSPSSASTFNYLSVNVNYNIVNNTDSTVPGLTINSGSGNSGAGRFYPASPVLL